MTRRSLLRAMACGWANAPRLLGEDSVHYSIAARPAQALLGDRITAVLSGVAKRGARNTFTFEDASLMLEVRREGGKGEPEAAFINRGGVASGERIVRMRPSGKRVPRRGERLRREVKLNSVFPRSMFDTGEFRISYRIGEGGQARQAGPASLRIESGPAAVTGLFGLLEDADLGVRTRAGGLLHRMTGHVTGYSAEPGAEAERRAAISRWRSWWEQEGRTLAWNFSSEGATFGIHPGAEPGSRRSRFVGGVAYGQQPLGADGLRAMTAALTEWLLNPDARAQMLKARVWVADQVSEYPRAGVMLKPAADVETLLEAAVSRLAALAGQGSISMEATGAAIILATMARMPEQRFVGCLSKLAHAAQGSAGWREAGRVASGLLDILDPGRVPVGAA